MDPEELALQIQMYEEIQKKHQRQKDREQFKEASKKVGFYLDNKPKRSESPAALGGKAQGFAVSKEDSKKTSASRKTEKPQQNNDEDDFFSNAN